MALVSGGRSRSTLNPDAPLFIPAVFRQVEDFSPEWWELVKTSTWFRDYWMDQNQEQESFDGHTEDDDDDDDLANFLPESIDLAIDEDFPNLEAQLADLVQYCDADETNAFQKAGLELDIETLLGNQQGLSKLVKERGQRSPIMSPKFLEKPMKNLSPKCTPRRIHQPR